MRLADCDGVHSPRVAEQASLQMSAVKTITGFELFNLLQHQKNWPSGGAPVLFDVRSTDLYMARHIKGAHQVSLSASGEINAPAQSWWDKVVCVYDADPSCLEDHPVARAVASEGLAKELLLLNEPYASFEQVYRFLTARGGSKSAMKRPIYPSCILPGPISW